MNDLLTITTPDVTTAPVDPDAAPLAAEQWSTILPPDEAEGDGVAATAAVDLERLTRLPLQLAMWALRKYREAADDLSAQCADIDAMMEPLRAELAELESFKAQQTARAEQRQQYPLLVLRRYHAQEVRGKSKSVDLPGGYALRVRAGQQQYQKDDKAVLERLLAMPPGIVPDAVTKIPPPKPALAWSDLKGLLVCHGDGLALPLGIRYTGSSFVNEETGEEIAGWTLREAHLVEDPATGELITVPRAIVDLDGDVVHPDLAVRETGVVVLRLPEIVALPITDTFSVEHKVVATTKGVI
jgi:hypothetical protein